MTRNLQFRGRALDEGVTYPVTDDERKELAVYGSHIDVPAPEPEVQPTPEVAADAAPEPGREAAEAAPDTETAQAPATSARKRRA